LIWLYSLFVCGLVVPLDDDVLDGRVRLDNVLRSHLNVGAAQVCVKDLGLERAVGAGLGDERADEALVAQALLGRERLAQQVQKVT
jgi:hypothetical protein